MYDESSNWRFFGKNLRPGESGSLLYSLKFTLKSVQQCPKADVNKYGGLDSDGGHSELRKVATLCTWSVSGWV